MAAMEATGSRSLENIRVVVIVLLGFVPVLIGWTLKVYGEPRPFWAGYYDPETIHFYAGLQILRGEVPDNADNPATPLQVLSAVIERAGNMRTLDFERFRAAGYLVGIVLMLCGGFLLARFLLRGLSPALQLTALWIYFYCPHALIYSAIWSPELLYFTAGAGALILLDRAIANGSASAVFLAGAGVGLLCAIKLTFLAWLPAIVVAIALVSWPVVKLMVRDVVVTAAGVVASFLVCTWPVHQRYGQMARWATNVATRKGFYGRGQVGLPPVSTLAENLRGAVLSGKVFYGFFVLGVLLLLVALWSGRGKERREAIAASAFVAIATVFSFAMALKHFNLRYLLPVGLVAVYAFVAGARRSPRLASARFAWPLFILAALFVFKNVLHDFRTHVDTIDQQATIRRDVEGYIARTASRNGRSNPVIIYSDFPTPSFALRYFCTSDDLPVLDREFPREGTLGTVLHAEVRLPPGATDWDYLIIAERGTELLPNQWGWIRTRNLPLVRGYYVVPRSELLLREKGRRGA